ncbi:OmpA family protein [Fulvivirgaceae bacterium BMA10]|uniref:OmpA family protein n=1 Tax=Splendidivirga corallicola TaxID=3051826 RepID=A0ABT8KKC3_9BACT|nr:OmpA family protein [Fulvivirgaceae bacterium BMA10]
MSFNRQTYLIISSTLILLAQRVSGQSSLIQSGDDHYNKLEYKAATKDYEKFLSGKSDFITKLKLAHCYEKLNNPEKTVYWYQRATKLKPLKSSDKLKLAIALTEIGNYDEAVYWFEVYNKEVPHDHIAINYIKAINNLEQFYANTHKYKVNKLTFNGQYADFSPTYYGEGIIFVSARSQKLFSNNLHLWDQTPFLDLFYYNESTNTVEPFNKKINSAYHEGPVTFFEGGGKILFTRNSYYKGKTTRGEDGTLRLQLYQADLINGKWSGIKAFPYNNENYSVGHPTILHSGKILYFVSDQPGGMGETDIYRSVLGEDGSWSEPENVGDKINTKGKEMFPFLHDERTLYFASDGLGGLGGLDIFEAHLDRAGNVIWVKNIGSPINSNRDDFGLILDQKKQSGYFSSNRKGGQGGDDIYHVKIFNRDILVKGIVVDKLSKQPLAGVRLKVMENDIENNFMLTSDDGLFEFSVEPEELYRLAFKKLQYKSVKDSLSTAGLKPGTTLNLMIEMEKTSYLVNAVAFQKETFLPIKDKNVVITLLNETTGTLDSLHSDPDGEVELVVQPESDYLLKAEKNNYFTLSRRFSTRDVHKPTTFEIELPMQEIVLDRPIKIENIYYDFNKWLIRKDALPELEKLLQLLMDNPTLRIELSSHTDSRGEDAYNMELSQKRAESVVNYLVSRGVSKQRLTAKGYGETRLLNYCSGFVDCDEADHQINRRTEFTVIGNINNINSEKEGRIN